MCWSIGTAPSCTAHECAVYSLASSLKPLCDDLWTRTHLLQGLAKKKNRLNLTLSFFSLICQDTIIKSEWDVMKHAANWDDDVIMYSDIEKAVCLHALGLCSPPSNTSGSVRALQILSSSSHTLKQTLSWHSLFSVGTLTIQMSFQLVTTQKLLWNTRRTWFLTK